MTVRTRASARAPALAALGEEALKDRVRSGPLPRHVAIIMDGNGRWALRRGLPRMAGHREGVKAVRRTVRAAGELGLEYLTLYAFSSENWQRPSGEVSSLMWILESSVDSELPELMAHNVRFRVIGRPGGVPAGVRRGIDRVVEATAGNTGLNLVVAFNYGARGELVDACRTLARAIQAGDLRPEQIDERQLATALYTHGLPDPDLVIRTSGEMRISNFLLWQIAYAELWVTPTLWPDFQLRDLLLGVVDFQQRSRRFGKV